MKKIVVFLFISVLFSTSSIFANDFKEVSYTTSETLETQSINEVNNNSLKLKEKSLSISEDKEKAIKVFETYEDINLDNVVFENFEYDNYNYTKDTINIDRITQKDVKEQIEQIEIIISPDEKEKFSAEDIINLFEDELLYEKDDCKGILKKDISSLQIEPNQVENVTTYTSQTITLTENKVYYGFESNDYSLIPRTIVKNGVTLKLVDASFVSTNNEAISTVANTGVSTLYNCNTLYKGSYTKKIPNTKTVILDYKATINYKGDIVKETFEKNVITVNYIGDKMLNLAVPIATTTGSGVFGFIIFLFVKKNAKIYNIINGNYQLIGKYKVTTKNRAINLTALSMKANSNAYKIVFDNCIAKRLNNQEINITLNNITKLKKLQYEENSSFIDVTF